MSMVKCKICTGVQKPTRAVGRKWVSEGERKKIRGYTKNYPHSRGRLLEERLPNMMLVGFIYLCGRRVLYHPLKASTFIMMLVGFYLPVRLGAYIRGKHKNTWVGKSILASY